MRVRRPMQLMMLVLMLILAGAGSQAAFASPQQPPLQSPLQSPLKPPIQPALQPPSQALSQSPSPAAPAAGDLRHPGIQFMSTSTQAMQRDDTLNPAMLWVKDGEALWRRSPGGAAQSCAGCHGDATRSMRGVAARYPSFEEKLRRPIDLAARINLCRQTHQKAPQWMAQSAELLALESYLALQSRGMPIAPPADVRLTAFRERGQARFFQRMGQLDLSCAQCHDARAGLRLGSSPIPQAHPEGYPVYRLEWQGVGSLERRLRNCMSGVRAESFASGSVELVELELYLAQRARGMAVDAPGVRP
jgi:sulfur-oxidizing protein SoxA